MAQEVTSANQIPILVRRAFHDCNAAPTGPVFLSLAHGCRGRDEYGEHRRSSTIDRNSVAGSLDLLADYLAAVEPRVIMIAGDEVSASDAAPEAVLVAETLGTPVFGPSWPARIPFPTSHPLWAGNMPTKATISRAGWSLLGLHLRARRQVAHHRPLYRGLGCSSEDATSSRC